MPIAVAGLVIGAALAFATMFAPRLGKHWFTISLGIVVGLMMVSYVSLPARLIGVKPHQPIREKLTTSAIGGIIGATVCTPPYLLGRLGILMLGSKVLFVPGLFVLTIGVTLQAGRRDQTASRAGAKKLEWDAHFGLVKLNPLADWTTAQIWDYVRANDLPYNALHDRNYPSVGCTHCTRPVQIGEDPRAGRWVGFQKTECGLHAKE